MKFGPFSRQFKKILKIWPMFIPVFALNKGGVIIIPGGWFWDPCISAARLWIDLCTKTPPANDQHAELLNTKSQIDFLAHFFIFSIFFFFFPFLFSFPLSFSFFFLSFFFFLAEYWGGPSRPCRPVCYAPGYGICCPAGLLITINSETWILFSTKDQ